MKTKLTQTFCTLAATFLALGASGQSLPTIVCSPAQLLECSPTNGVVEATVLDLDGDALMVVWSVNGSDAQTNLVASGSTSNGVTLSLSFPFSLGTNEVLVEVSDDGSNIVSCTSIVTVQDTTPPVIHAVTATPNTLWPPNHKMRPIRVQVRAEDICGPTQWIIHSITSNEPDDGLGDGHTSPDWAIRAPHNAWVRAERAGRGSGRVYTINVSVSDESGNTTNGAVQVRVPHDRGNGKPYKGKYDNEGYEDHKGNGKGKDKAKGNGKGKK